MNTVVKSPIECDKKELKDFEALVLKGGEVSADGLADRIRKAAWLMFLTLPNNSLIGVSALKRPDPQYRAGVFHKAQSKLPPTEFGLEVGWIFVLEQERGKKLSRILLEQLLPHAKEERVYATMRENNEPMIRTHERYGFQREGDSFPGRENYSLVLYVR